MPLDGGAADWTAKPFPNGQTLKPNQRVAAEFLTHGRFRLLAMKPRLGKTYSSLGAVNAMLQDFRGNVVVVCPAGLRSGWRSKIDELRDGNWSSYVLGFNDVSDGKITGLPAVIDILIIDESHYLKNRESQRTIAMLGANTDLKEGLAGRARFVWCLSGTPVPNSPTEIWTLLRAFAPESIPGVTGRPMCFGDFQDKYCATMSTMQGRRVVGGRRLGELRTAMTPFTLVQDYSVMPDAPDPPRPETVYVEVGASDARAIRELEFSKEGRAVREILATRGVAGLSKLGTNGATLRRLLGVAKVPAVCEMVDEYLKDDPTLKIVVFAWHTEVAAALKRRLQKHGPVAFSGGMSAPEQDSVKRRFAKDPKTRVLVGSISAASEGHDFSVADMLIRAESSWVPGQNDQCDLRIWNVEKRRPIAVKQTVLKGTTDDDVMRALHSKAKMSAALFD